MNKRDIPCVVLPLDYLKTDTFARLCDTKASKVYWFLRAYIIRKNPMGGTGNLKLYENYYMNNLLASRWSQDEIANKFKVKQPAVSKYIKELEEIGLLIKDIKRVGNRSCNVYILGSHIDGDEVYMFDSKIEEELNKSKTDFSTFSSNATELNKSTDILNYMCAV